MTIDANDRRVILAALETYQSTWAVAVTEARKDGEPIDERLAQGRYDETGELLAKLKREPEGASPVEMIGKLDVNIAAEQARDRLRRQITGQSRGLLSSFAEAYEANFDPASGEDALGRESKSAPYGLAGLERLDHNLDDLR